MFGERLYMGNRMEYKDRHKTVVLLLVDRGILSLPVARALVVEDIDAVHEFSVNHVPVEMSKNSRHVESYKTYGSFDSFEPLRLIESYFIPPRLSFSVMTNC